MRDNPHAQAPEARCRARRRPGPQNNSARRQLIPIFLVPPRIGGRGNAPEVIHCNGGAGQAGMRAGGRPAGIVSVLEWPSPRARAGGRRQTWRGARQPSWLQHHRARFRDGRPEAARRGGMCVVAANFGLAKSANNPDCLRLAGMSRPTTPLAPGPLCSLCVWTAVRCLHQRSPLPPRHRRASPGLPTPAAARPDLARWRHVCCCCGLARALPARPAKRRLDRSCRGLGLRRCSGGSSRAAKASGET